MRIVPLDTVTVQGLGTPGPALRAPFPVSVVQEAEIRQARPALALTDALSALPGVQVDNRFNYALGERISVRGLGARAQFGVRGVRVLVDGIPATLPDGQTTLNHVDPSALGRAEVIRGPASALYGNASGGVIRLSTRRAAGCAAGVRAPGAGREPRAAANGDQRRRTRRRGGVPRLRLAPVVRRLPPARIRREPERRRHARLCARRGRGAAVVHRGALRRAQPRLALRLAAAGGPRRRLRAQRGAAHGRGGAAGAGGALVAAPGRPRRAGGGGVRAGARRIDNPIPNAVIDLDRRVGGVRATLVGGCGGAALAGGRGGGGAARRPAELRATRRASAVRGRWTSASG